MVAAFSASLGGAVAADHNCSDNEYVSASGSPVTLTVPPGVYFLSISPAFDTSADDYGGSVRHYRKNGYGPVWDKSRSDPYTQEFSAETITVDEASSLEVQASARCGSTRMSARVMLFPLTEP